MVSAEEKSSSRTHSSLVSVVFSFRNEEQVLPELIKRVTEALNPVDIDYKLVFVNDDSTDRSLELLKEYAKKDPRIVVISMSRRFGVGPCVLAGLRYAQDSDAVVYMDADLQDPPELIPQLLERWRSGADVVHTKRRSRQGEKAFKMWITRQAYKILRFLSEVDIQENCGDFKLISNRALKELLKLRETDPFMRGMVAWIGFKQEIFLYDRHARFSGETHFPLLNASHAKEFVRGLASFSVIPLYLSLVVGFLASFIAFGALLVILVDKYLGFNLPGWTAIMTSNLFLGGSIHLALGFIGIYIARIYNELKGRPLYIVQDVIDDDSSSKEKMKNGHR